MNQNSNPFDILDLRLTRIETLLSKIAGKESGMKEKRIVNIKTYAEYVGFSVATIYGRLCKGEKVPGAFKNGTKWFFDLNLYDKFQETLISQSQQ